MSECEHHDDNYHCEFCGGKKFANLKAERDDWKAKYYEVRRVAKEQRDQLKSELADADRVAELAKATAERYRASLEMIAAAGGASPGDKKHEWAAEALKR
jgi:hypothetical protein